MRWRFFRTLPLQKQKAISKASHASSRVLTHLLFRLFTNKPPSSPSRLRRRSKKVVNAEKPLDFPVPGGRSQAVKSGWVNRFHLSDSSERCWKRQTKQRQKTWRTWRTERKKIDFPLSKVQPYVEEGTRFLGLVCKRSYQPLRLVYISIKERFCDVYELKTLVNWPKIALFTKVTCALLQAYARF